MSTVKNPQYRQKMLGKTRKEDIDQNLRIQTLDSSQLGQFTTQTVDHKDSSPPGQFTTELFTTFVKNSSPLSKLMLQYNGDWYEQISISKIGL